MKLFNLSGEGTDFIHRVMFSGPFAGLSRTLRQKCDAIPRERRLTVVAVLFSLFVITAFFVFGHACYRIGQGRSCVEFRTGHIKPPELMKHSIPEISVHNDY